MLSDDAIQEILGRAMEVQFSRARPATRHFFEHRPPSEDQSRAVTIHKWVLAHVNDSDSSSVVHHLANRSVKEVVSAATAITGEMVFQAPSLLPFQPLWIDGSPLFSTHATVDNSARFGITDGNVVNSVGYYAEDVASAAARLSQLDEKFDNDERLQQFCAKHLERKLTRAAAKAGVPCRVFGIADHKDENSWVLMRDASACSLLIGKPTFSIPVRGNKIVVGARFVVWIDDPRLAVCVMPRIPS